MSWQWEKDVLANIHKYYPLSEEYTIEKYPYNESCTSLSQQCENARNDNQAWLSFLSSIQDDTVFTKIDDNTMLMYHEPSYQCAVVIEQSDNYKIEYIVCVSVIIDCFYIYRRIYESNEFSPPPLFYITEYSYNLADKQSDNPYYQLRDYVKSFFPSYREIPYSIVLKMVDDVIVPNHQDERTPIVFECLFNSRM